MSVRFASRLALALLVPATVLAGPSHGDSTVSPEQPTDAKDYVGSAFAQSNPAVAYDGTSYWAAWNGGVWGGPVQETHLTRVSTAGVVLDREPIETSVFASPPSLYGVQLAEAQLGTGRALVWLAAPQLAGQSYAINLAIVDATGATVSQSTIATGAQMPNAYVQVSSSGNHLVVSYSLDQTPAVVVVDSSGNVGAHVTGLGSAAAVAANAQSFLVATSTAATRYGYDGTKLGSVAWPALPAGTAAIGAAPGPTDDVVFLEQQVNYAGAPTCCGALSAMRVLPNDTLEDAAPIALGNAVGEPAAAWNGTGWELTWVSGQGEQASQIMAALLGASGTVTAQTPLATYSAGAAGTSITSGPAGQTLVAWVGSTNDVLGVRFDGAGTALDATPILLSTTAREESLPAIAHGNGAYLGVWRSEDLGVAGRLFDDTGKALGAGAITLGAQVAAPSVVAINDQFVVSWASPNVTNEYQAVRVGVDGTVKDAQSYGVFGSVIAAGGGVLLAMNAGQAAILDADGHTQGTPAPIASGSGGLFPMAAWNGSAFYVAFSDYDPIGSATYGRAALVAPSGAITPLPDQPLNEVPEAVTAIGSGRVLVTYSTASGRTLQVVDATGAPLGAALALDPGTFNSALKLASDADARALVEWQLPVLGTFRVDLAPGQAALVDFSSGALVMGTPFALSGAAYELGDAIASDGASGVALVLRASTTDSQRNPRMAYQTIQSPVPAPACDGGCAEGGAPPADGGAAGSGGDGGGGPTTSPAPTPGPADAGASNGAAPVGAASGCACSEGRSSGAGAAWGWIGVLGAIAMAGRARRTGRTGGARR